jgi:major membrane immunogen (membrane-anchored lipoprotein)
MKKRMIACICVSAAVLSILSGCGTKNYADGTYTGQSSVYESEEDEGNGNGYGVVTLTIQDHTIVACTFLTYEPDGTLKDEDYGLQDGTVANRDYYNKAQKAIAACEVYAENLVQTNDVKKVDAISGATINYNNFKEAVKDALKQAETD